MSALVVVVLVVVAVGEVLVVQDTLHHRSVSE